MRRRGGTRWAFRRGIAPMGQRPADSHAWPIIYVKLCRCVRSCARHDSISIAFAAPTSWGTHASAHASANAPAISGGGVLVRILSLKLEIVYHHIKCFAVSVKRVDRNREQIQRPMTAEYFKIAPIYPARLLDLRLIYTMNTPSPAYS